MAGTFIKIEVDDREIRERLAELRRLTGDLEPVLNDIGPYLERSHRERFQREEAPDGSKWQPLSPFYRDIKPQHRDMVLVLEEHLRNSFHYQIEDDGLLFGTDREYGAVHQFGEKKGATGKTTSRGVPIPWGDIPARPFIGLSDDDKKYIVEALEEHIKAAWG